MKVLIVSQKEVRQWLPMNECIEAVSDALKMLTLFLYFVTVFFPSVNIPSWIRQSPRNIPLLSAFFFYVLPY